MSYESNVAQYKLEYSVLDIAALQYIYGPSKNARTGDETYAVDASITNFIWDGAGNDTLSVAGASASATVYLTAGYQGFIGTKSSRITDAGQITVNFGTVIENLIGSSNADNLYGNAVANLIQGEVGSDFLSGLDGNDTLRGGSGVDSLTGGNGFDVFNYTQITDSTDTEFDTISALEAGDKITFTGMAGVTLKSDAFTFTSSISNTVTAIKNDYSIANKIVFFTDGTDGYVFIKGAGTGTDFSNSMVKVAGKTTAHYEVAI
jgi:Ca2+-binding RTX toxin-like protein